jgi:VWFA-related protein
VLVPALVQDNKGNFIPGLKPSDFTIKDNGKIQPVKFLQEIVAPPAEELEKAKLPPGTYSNNVLTPKAPLRVVIILFDMLNSHFKDQVPARIQLTKYLRTQIDPGTMVALLGLGRGGLRMYHDLTSDTQGLATELEMAMNSGRHSISTNLQNEMSETESEQSFVGHGAFAPTGSHGRSDRKIIILDTLAAFKNIAGAYSSLPGRKSLIWVTGGFPFEIDGSKSNSDGMPAMDKDSLMDILNDYQSTWQTLSDANIALYPVDMHGLMTTSMPDASYAAKRGGNAQAALGKFENQKQNRNEDNINTMTTFAGQTGGKAFYNDNNLVAGFKQAVDDTRSSYMLGYYLEDNAVPGWHKLHVDVNHPGAHIRARTGFLVKKVDPAHPDPHGKDPGSAGVDLAMESPMNFTGIPVTVRWVDNGQTKTVAADGTLNAKRNVAFQITLPPHTATLDETEGGHKVSLNIIALARTPKGDDAADLVKKIDGTLKPDVARRLDLAGIKFDSALALAPGYYNVRFIVRDNLNGNIGSVTAPVVVK